MNVIAESKGLLEIAEYAAREAGKFLKGEYGDEPEINSQIGKDIKLRADEESEQLVLSILKENSKYPILTEESGEISDDEIQFEDSFWVVDPLDGTFNYSRAIPHCCTSIGFWSQGKPVFGVLDHFLEGITVSGFVGETVHSNGDVVTTSGVLSAEKAGLASGFPVNRSFENEDVASFLKMLTSFKKVRFLGSAASSLSYVAQGKLDAYFEEDIMFWDVAAGLALVEAAGGDFNLNWSDKKKWCCHVMAGATSELLSVFPQGEGI